MKDKFALSNDFTACEAAYEVSGETIRQAVCEELFEE